MIAAVSGYAVAGGMEIALMCDLRVVEETATFGIYCRRFGKCSCLLLAIDNVINYMQISTVNSINSYIQVISEHYPYCFFF